MKTKIIHIYSDSGHGWAKVTLKELLKLGIADKISSCSYYRPYSNISKTDIYVYLEEDCDFGIYLNAINENKINIVMRNHHTDKYSKIRGYNCFDGKTLMENYKKAQESIAKQFIDSHFIFQKVGE